MRHLLLHVSSSPADGDTRFADLRRPGKEGVVVLRLDDRAVHVERGVGLDMRGAKSTRRDHRTAASARKAYDTEYKKLDARDWYEIGVALVPAVGHALPTHVRRALLLGAASELDAKAAAKTQEEAVETKVRAPLLRDLVTSGKRVHVKGKLVLPTGKLVAYDPMLIATADSALPFETALRPGAYPVVLSLREGLIAAASVIVADGAPERWTLALPRGMKRLVPANIASPAPTLATSFPSTARRAASSTLRRSKLTSHVTSKRIGFVKIAV